MKKITKLFLFFCLILCVPILFTACESGKIASYSITYTSGLFKYDAFSSALLVEYGSVLNLSESDFDVYRINQKNKRQKTTNFTLDASSVNGKKLPVGDFKIYFTSKKEDYKQALTVRVFEREIAKPTLDFYSVQFGTGAVDIELYLATQPGFDSQTMEVVDSSASSISETNTGKYTTLIKPKYGYVWDTLSGKTEPVEFKWEIVPRVISEPAILGSSILEIDVDQNYQIKESVLKFENSIYNNSAYKITGNRATNVGNYQATAEIINSNYIFQNNQTKIIYNYLVNPKEILNVDISGASEFTYSGSKIVPELENYIPEIMTMVEPNSIDAGIHKIQISFKPEYENLFVWKGSSEKQIFLLFKINKKQIAKPVLKNNLFTYTGVSPTLEFDNFNDQLLKISDTSSNVDVGIYIVQVQPKSVQISNSYAYENSEYLSTLSFTYMIDKATIAIDIIWNVPDGQTLSANMVASGSVSCETIDISVSNKLFLKQQSTYVQVDAISVEGEYKLVLDLEFDNKNYLLINANSQQAITDSDLEMIFQVLS